MNKKIVNKINGILKFCLLILLIISSFVNDRYCNFNAFEKIFKAPFLELTYIFNKLIDFRIAYFLTFILGFIFIWPTFASCFNKLKNLSSVWRKIMTISKRDVKTDEEQIKKVQDMLNLYEKEGISFLETCTLILCVILGANYLSVMFNSIFVHELFLNENFKVLWFQLNDYDKLYILPSLCIIFIFIIPIIKNIISLKRANNELLKSSAISNILITLACGCLLLSSIFGSSIFAIFILIIYIKAYFKFKRKLVSEDEKSINQIK